MVIFGSPGRVMAIQASELAIPLSMEMERWPDGAGRQFKAIITSVAVSSQGGFQFLHSLRQYVYIYIFGERVGELTVSGLTFSGGCEDNPDVPKSGMEAVLAYYNLMRATRRPCPVGVRVGGTAFRGFLLGVQLAILDADSGLGRFTLKFHTPPGDIASTADIPYYGSGSKTCVVR